MKIKFPLLCLLLCMLYCPATELMAQTVERGPYLQLTTPNSVIIRWRTDVSTSSKVWYGTDPNNLNQSTSPSGSTKEHSVELSGLTAATKYYYRIGNNNNQYTSLSTGQYFKTHPSGNTNNQVIRAWMLGNAGTGDSEQATVRDAYYSVIGDEHVDMILFTGDNAYDDGKDSEYQELIFEMYEKQLATTTAWSCFGNHDAGDAQSSDESGTYYDVFDFPKNAEAGGLPSGTEAYFSFDYGNMHVISLNTVDVDRDTDGDMLQWLQADLDATDKKWKVVLLHHRPYTGSNNNDSDDDPKPTDVRENFLPIMESGGVDLVLSSHSHSYQRSYLINGHYGKSNTFDPATMGLDMGDGQSDGDGVYSKVNSDLGTVYVVAGTAGQDRSGADDLNHPVMHYNSGSAGSVQLLVSDSELLFQFINENEQIEDYFTIEKASSGFSDEFYISNPLSGATFPALQNITITTEVSNQAIPLISHVNFYINDNFMGTDNNFPYYYSWTIPSNNQYQIKANAIDANGDVLFVATTNISAGSQDICVSVSSSSDDAEEDDTGDVNTSSGDLELIDDGGAQQVGIRFTNLNIPPGTIISEAYLQFMTDETANINPCTIQIHGEKNPNPSTFAKQDNNISNRNKTITSVNWSPSNWQIVGQAGSNQRSPDLSAIVQEIVNQPNFTTNSAIAFLLSGNGKRVADSYDGGSEKAPQLCISYIPAPCADLDNDGICDDNDPCPAGPELGLPCDDNNPFTFNDLVDENCNCIGSPGYCPGLQLPIGASCNDNDPTTYNDLVTPDCNCTGTPFDCTILLANIGTPCNDNNNTTYDDIITANCNCEGTPFDCPLYLADIGSPCDDGNPNTSNDILDANCNCSGSLFDCPIIERNFGDPCDDGNAATINDVVHTSCDCVGTLLQEETIVVAVQAKSDDAEEGEDGDTNTSSGDLELVEDGENQLVGIRFINTGIPATATITSAYIQFTTDETNNINPCFINISGQKSNNALTFEKSNQNISSRPKTNSTVSWQPDQWTSVGAAGLAQRTSDISNIIQELVNQPGFADGAPMAFIFDGQGKRVADSYDGGADKAPKLVVSYVFFCEDDDNDGVCNPQDICTGPEPGSPCNDNNSTTYGDVIDANCNCTGTPYDCIDLLANFGASCNDGDPLTLNDMVDENCNCTGTTPGSNLTVCTRVQSSEDDAEEEDNGGVNTSSSDLELVLDDVNQLIGIRFTDLGIPQGAIIETANIQFEVDETNNINPCQITISAEASDHAAPFNKSDFNISNRPRTGTEIYWSPVAWTNKGDAGPAQQTSNIASVIQEVVNRPGYTTNSAIALILDGYGKRVADSFDGGAEKAPELCVTYSMSAPPDALVTLPNNSLYKAETDVAINNGAIEKSEIETSANRISGLSIYPNPTKGDLYISMLNESLTETQILVQDVNGQLMKSVAVGLTKGDNVISLLDMSLGNGVYIVRIWTGDIWESRKFVVVR